jgi:curved DNA-binding protein CbpA
MDDYYELLDVAPDADRDDIRGAYRAKRDEAQAKAGDDSRGRIAELNRAWNVLSDPTQRQRYDERLADSRDSGDEDDEYDDDGDEGERPIPVTRAQRRDEVRKARGKQRLPTIVLPKGVTMAPTRNRITAMLIDLLVLLVLFTTVQYFGVKQVDNRHPGESQKATQEVKDANKVQDRINADKKKVSDAQKKHDTVAENVAKAQQAKDQKAHDKLKADVDRIDRELAPGLKLVFFIGIVIAFLYLVPSTALTGQTLGKRIQGIRAARLDGSVPGWSSAVVRFGVPLLVASFLGIVLSFGLLGLAVAVIGMVGWVTQPNRQGLHDRLAKTVVVEA